MTEVAWRYPSVRLSTEITQVGSLPVKLAELRFKVWHVGENTRLTGAGFTPVDVIEIAVDGK